MFLPEIMYQGQITDVNVRFIKLMPCFYIKRAIKLNVLIVHWQFGSIHLEVQNKHALNKTWGGGIKFYL